MLITHFVGFGLLPYTMSYVAKEKKVISKVSNIVDIEALEDAVLKSGRSPKMSWWPPQEAIGLHGVVQKDKNESES